VALRKLASIQQVLAIDPIPDADNIVRVTINGWTVVSQKGNFAVGDLGVFYETDSVPPDIDLYKFLWTTKDNPEGIRPPKYRLKAMRLRGCLSQGLMLRLDQVIAGHNPNLSHAEIDLVIAANQTVGTDLTADLGIEKYEKPIEVGGVIIGDWNFRCPKTDEERLQSRPGFIDEMRGKPYIITQKQEGMSLTIGMDRDGELAVCIRNNAVQWRNVENIYSFIMKKYNLEFLIENILTDLIFQGELCGPKIENNFLELKEPDWFIFNIWSISQQRYLTHTEAIDIYGDHNLTHVPWLEGGDNFQYTMEDLIAMAPGKYPGTNRKREEIVIRPRDEELYSPAVGGRLSIKVIADDYALAEKD
jgi:RNA ligase (TIGR02306 family)